MTRIGDRVSLISCSDEHTRLQPGEMGTVTLIDSLGTVHVAWDSGSKLGLIPEAGDSWVVRPPDTESAAQQEWADGMTDEQREAYEDGIARRRAEREAAG